MREFRIGRTITYCGMLVSVAIFAGGCATSSRENAGIGIGNMQLAELKRHEYQILDTVEGQGKVTKVLGIGGPLFSKQWGWTRQSSGWAFGIQDGIFSGIGYFP